MILIVGGRGQGKKTFAEKILTYTGGPDFSYTIADGEKDSLSAAMKADIVRHMELYIRRLLESGEDPERFVKDFIDKNKEAIVIADEIGMGIVPSDVFEREYRERAGRLCQRLASVSGEVYRIVCGIETKIKG